MGLNCLFIRFITVVKSIRILYLEYQDTLFRVLVYFALSAHVLFCFNLI